MVSVVKSTGSEIDLGSALFRCVIQIWARSDFRDSYYFFAKRALISNFEHQYKWIMNWLTEKYYDIHGEYVWDKIWQQNVFFF